MLLKLFVWPLFFTILITVNLDGTQAKRKCYKPEGNECVRIRGKECTAKFIQDCECFKFYKTLSGRVRVNGNCVCPNGKVMYKTQCQCPDNSEIINGKCVCKGLFKRDGDYCACKKIYKTELGPNKECVCRDTYTLKNNSCVCPVGYTEIKPYVYPYCVPSVYQVDRDSLTTRAYKRPWIAVCRNGFYKHTNGSCIKYNSTPIPTF